MWSYSPKVNRVIKVPSSMMGQSWMGSDFSNKDVSRADDIVDQYDHTLLDKEEHDGHTVYVIESIPHEEAAVVWGKEILRVRDDHVLVSQEFCDQEGILVKTLRRWRSLRWVAGPWPCDSEWRRRTPTTSGPRCRIDSVEFDVDISDNVFTRSNLQNPRE